MGFKPAFKGLKNCKPITLTYCFVSSGKFAGLCLVFFRCDIWLLLFLVLKAAFFSETSVTI